MLQPQKDMLNLERKCKAVKAILDKKITIVNMAKRLNTHPTTIKRWCDKYEKYGKTGLIHKNTNKESNRKKDISVVLDFIKENKLYDCNFSLLSELLKEEKDFSITSSCIRTNLFKLGMLSPKATKRVRKIMRKQLKEKSKKETLSIAASETLESLELEKQTSMWVHPSKSKSKYMGERLEMDACEINNLFGDGKKYTLHVCVDDATGSILGLYLDKQETLNGYFNVLEQVLLKYGIPYSIRSDKRTVFIYEKKNNAKLEDDTYTQFGYACHNLGINLSSCSIAEFKPKVERMNGSLQDRIPSIFKVKNINTIDNANDYLINTYIDKHNRQFSYGYSYSKNDKKAVEHKFIPISKEDIKTTLVTISQRVIKDDYCFSFNNKKYIVCNENGTQRFFNFKTKVDVIKTLDNQIYVKTSNGKLFYTRLLEDRKQFSPNFDSINDKPNKITYKFIPITNSEHWSSKEQIEFKKYKIIQQDKYYNKLVTCF